MKTKQHNLTSEPDLSKSETTESFTKVPNRYWSQKWYLKPSYHIIFHYLISQAKYPNQLKNKLAVGQCTIGTIDLSKKFNIPQPTIFRILKFLESINEISLQPTNKYTIVTINYLRKNEYQNVENEYQNVENEYQNVENEYQKTVINTNDSTTYKNIKKEMNNKNEKMNNKMKKMNTLIDDIDIIDIRNKMNFVDSKIINNQKKTNMTKETKINPLLDNLEPDSAKVPAQDIELQQASQQVNENSKARSSNKTSVQDKDIQTFTKANKVNKLVQEPDTLVTKSFTDNLLQVWCEEYSKSRHIDYVVHKGKDTGGIAKLLELFKKQQPDLDTQSMVEYFRKFFKQVLAINDQFIQSNCNPAFIYSQLNKINMILNGYTKQKQFVSSAGYGPVNPDYTKKLT